MIPSAADEEERMKSSIARRDFLKMTASGGAAWLAAPALAAAGVRTPLAPVVGPGCRKDKVKVAKIYLGQKAPHWPTPSLDLAAEVRAYEAEFLRMKKEFADVDFVVDELASSPEDIGRLKGPILSADGILAVHLTIGTDPVIDAIQSLGKPTLIYSAPYSGHEWVGFAERLKQPHMDAILTGDKSMLACAVRPFRAIHQLGRAKILNLTTADFREQAEAYRNAFGTETKIITLERAMAAYEAVSDRDARREAEIWIGNAEAVVEPSKEDIVRSCRLALALERLLNEEEATALTVDCYGTMFDTTIKLPAYPCLGFARLNNIGLAGICESDLRSAVTHILFQGLSGRPGFISDPTVDEGTGTIILAHCMGTPKMDGPEGPSAAYKLRTIMEREEGVVPQAEMRVGQSVTQGILIGTDQFRFFRGEIAGSPVSLSDNRGCRTKIAVRVDGDLPRLWRNWSHGLHRVTVYGDVVSDLRRFCKFMKIELVDEAA
jgi:hypothetical protein